MAKAQDYLFVPVKIRTFHIEFILRNIHRTVDVTVCERIIVTYIYYNALTFVKLFKFFDRYIHLYLSRRRIFLDHCRKRHFFHCIL